MFSYTSIPIQEKLLVVKWQEYSEKYLESIAQMFDIVHVLFRIATRFRLHTIPQTRVLSGPAYVSQFIGPRNSNKQVHFSIVSQKTSSEWFNSAS
jgi:hypothetical protein